MPEPHYHSHEEFRNRINKLSSIQEMGLEPYPHRYIPSIHAKALLAHYGDSPIGSFEEAEKGATPSVKVVGRLILFRAMGKNAFGHIQDGEAKLQVMFNRDLTQVEGFTSTEELTNIKFIEKKIDLGDFLGIEGHLFRTQKGEITVFVKRVTLLVKALLPLPEKHSGIVDKEMRYRKRWLDLIAHDEVRTSFRLRSEIVQHVRQFLVKQHFMEVETPILQNTYGGASARPFTTHLHAHDQQMFLRISPEISLKKLLVGGMERIFEIGKVFRNEGIDKTHNPEFTILEAYGAYLDYQDLMVLVENLVASIATALFDTTLLPHTIEEGKEPLMIDFKTPWKRLSMKESIKEYGGIDIDSLTDTQMRELLKKETSLDPKVINAAPRGLLIASIFDEKVVHQLTQPHHIIDHPIETTPLCKPHRDKKLREEGLVERFETFIGGKELCNAYTELNDPVIQRKLLEEQVKKRDAGDEEAHPLDEEFIEAICQGMPPAGGFGIGIDRLVMLLTNAATIRDVIYFPIMRPL